MKGWWSSSPLYGLFPPVIYYHTAIIYIFPLYSVHVRYENMKIGGKWTLSRLWGGGERIFIQNIYPWVGVRFPFSAGHRQLLLASPGHTTAWLRSVQPRIDENLFSCPMEGGYSIPSRVGGSRPRLDGGYCLLSRSSIRRQELKQKRFFICLPKTCTFGGSEGISSFSLWSVLPTNINSKNNINEIAYHVYSHFF